MNEVITEKVILFRISKTYKSGMSEEQLYNATRGVWKLGVRREEADYAISVANGIVLEVYKILYWENAECYEERITHDMIKNKDRYQFVGEVDVEMNNKYKNMNVKGYFKKGNANPFKYVNF